VKLCMFSPRDRDLPRGWPGRIDGDRVVQLAAQTLQSFFTGGGEAREHEEYALGDVVLRAPVLHPPTVRIFGQDGDFTFANSAAIYGPEDAVPLPAGVDQVESDLRIAAVIGAYGAVGGFTLMNDWVAPEFPGAKARDFAISLGPVVVTPEEFPSRGDWSALVEHAGRNTRLLPGDILAAGSMRDGPYCAGDVVEVKLEEIGVLRNTVAARP
jgi:fumarylacetoacetate (FAA) hydrolase